MKKHDVMERESGSAEFVVAHAKWQRSRGRQPSMSFEGQRNPRKALEAARAYLCRFNPMRGDSYREVWGPPRQIGPELFAIDIMCGSTIDSAIREVIQIARGLAATMQFDFNGVTVQVNADSSHVRIRRDWRRTLSGYIKGIVGPYPKSILTDEEKANDERIEAEKERQRQERELEYRTRERFRQIAVEAKLLDKPPMEVSDEETWRSFIEKNRDGYGGAVITYSERWAMLMQLEMANGKSLEEVAEATSREADLEGITGFMYGCAVSVLARCWKHGDQLRRWHNLDTQIHDEGEKANESGGVLNPALLGVAV